VQVWWRWCCRPEVSRARCGIAQWRRSGTSWKGAATSGAALLQRQTTRVHLSHQRPSRLRLILRCRPPRPSRVTISRPALNQPPSVRVTLSSFRRAGTFSSAPLQKHRCASSATPAHPGPAPTKPNPPLTAHWASRQFDSLEPPPTCQSRLELAPLVQPASAHRKSGQPQVAHARPLPGCWRASWPSRRVCGSGGR
jgi:hypothetical protein